MNKSILVLVSLLICLACAKTLWFQLDSYTFEDYELEFRKSYQDDVEREFRMKIFHERLHEIRKHNRGNHSWKKGVNQFTDRTESERAVPLGYDRSLGLHTMRKSAQNNEFSKDTSGLPDFVDWREKHVVSPVKDQGSCGSCWAFGSSETIESHWAIKTGQLFDFSEQQITSCTPNTNACGGTGGCQGGIAELAYQSVTEKGGLATEWTYPYISYRGETNECKFNRVRTPPVAKVLGYTTLTSNDYNSVLTAVAEQGPLAVNVDAGDWHEYESGIFTGCNLNATINHVVQLVGYGTEGNQDYWLVRNSWAPSWGESGYIRLERTSTPSCGTDFYPQDGTGCNGGPATVTVCGACGILYSVTFPYVHTN